MKEDMTDGRRGGWRPVSCIIIALIASALVVAGGYTFLVIMMGVTGAGSPKLAERWSKELEGFAGPDSSGKADPLIDSKTYPNGEWVFGLSQNSHGPWWLGGGMVVLKDSR